MVLPIWATYTTFHVLTTLYYFFTEMSILKCLYLFKWSRMAMVDDTFLVTCLKVANCTYSLGALFIRSVLGEYESNQNVNFLLNKEFVSKPLHVEAHLWTSAVVAFILTILVIAANILAVGGKINHDLQSRNSSVHSNMAVAAVSLNNNAFNENIVTYKSTLVLVLSVAIMIAPFLVMRHLDVLNTRNVVVGFYFMYSASCILYPSTYFLRKPRHFKTALSEMNIMP